MEAEAEAVVTLSEGLGRGWDRWGLPERGGTVLEWRGLGAERSCGEALEWRGPRAERPCRELLEQRGPRAEWSSGHGHSREPHGTVNLTLNRSLEKFHQNEILHFGSLPLVEHLGLVCSSLPEMAGVPGSPGSHLGGSRVADAQEGVGRREGAGLSIFIPC